MYYELLFNTYRRIPTILLQHGYNVGLLEAVKPCDDDARYQRSIEGFDCDTSDMPEGQSNASKARWEMVQDTGLGLCLQ